MACYDVREVRLIKTSVKATISSVVSKNQEMSYLCLGHFDVLQVFPVEIGPSKAPLLRIREAALLKDKTCDNSGLSEIDSYYVDRFYTLSECSHGCTTFWEKDSHFLIMARIHCDALIGTDKEKQQSEDKWRGINSKQSFVKRLLARSLSYPKREGSSYSDLSSFSYQVSGGITVEGCIYESLELGDLVCFLKGDSLSPLLEHIRFLYEDRHVSDVYSYIGLNYAKLMDYNAEEDPPRTQLLPYLSSRFAVRRAAAAEKFIKKYWSEKAVEESFHVVGTSDILYDWEEKNEQSLLKVFQVICKDINNRDNLYYEAFFDVVTRIGIQYCSPEKASREEDLASYRLDIFDNQIDYSWLNNTVHVLPTEWGPTLKRLIGTLRTMTANSVMDDLAAMLIPSIQAFLSRLETLYKQGSPWNLYNDCIIYFVDRWERIMVELTQQESQLTQHPELSGVPHSIPAMLLQFQQGFVREAANVFGSQGESGVVPVIFPGAVDHIRTRSILKPRDLPQESIFPLSIEVPTEQLYDVYKTAVILSHEVAHYCGRDLRRREERLECLYVCYSYMIANLWNRRVMISPYYKKNIEKFPAREPFEYPSLLEGEGNVKERIQNCYCRHLNLDDNPVLLNSIQRTLFHAAVETACSHNDFERFRNYVISGALPQDQLAYLERPYWLADYDWFKVYEEVLQSHGKLLMHLVKECYADIAMIILLRCTVDDYYNAVFGVELHRLEARRLLPLPSSLMRRHLYRLDLVVNAIKCCDKKWAVNSEQLMTKLINESKCGEAVWNEKQFSGNILLEPEKKILTGYLRDCAKNLENHMKRKKKKVENLRNILLSVRDDNFDWNALRHYAETCSLEWQQMFE